MSPVVIWMSRHAPRASQISALNALYPGVKVLQDPNPFGDARDIVDRYRKSGAVDMVIVAPLAVIAELVKLGIRPLWAEMEIVPCDDPRVSIPYLSGLVSNGDALRHPRPRRGSLNPLFSRSRF